MTTFSIINPASGEFLGEYDAADKAAALEAMSREAGYRDITHLSTATGIKPEKLVVEVVGDINEADMADFFNSFDSRPETVCVMKMAADDGSETHYRAFDEVGTARDRARLLLDEHGPGWNFSFAIVPTSAGTFFGGQAELASLFAAGTPA